MFKKEKVAFWVPVTSAWMLQAAKHAFQKLMEERAKLSRNGALQSPCLSGGVRETESECVCV